MNYRHNILYNAHQIDGNGGSAFSKGASVRLSELEGAGFDLRALHQSSSKYRLAVREGCHQRAIVEPINPEAADPTYKVLRIFTDGRPWVPAITCPVLKANVLKRFATHFFA